MHIKALVIDDDADIRGSVRLAIQEQDYLDVDVIESQDVASGIKQLIATKPDIVILDLHMHHQSGFDFMDIMHKSGDFTHTKVIMLTVDDTLNNIFEAEKRGIDPYYFLGKPFNISDLQSMILSICLPVNA